MITKLRIKNFKCLGDTGDMDIRPLTVLVGPNSGGKSSILQCLLMLRQTVDSRDVENPLLLNGPYVELGAYTDVVFGKDPAGALEVDLCVGRHVATSFDAGPAASGWLSPPISLLCRFGYDPEAERVILTKSAVTGEGLSFSISRQGSHYRARARHKGAEYRFSVGAVHKFYGFLPRPGRGRSHEREMAYYRTRWLAADFETQFGSLFYVGPMRMSPQRVHMATGEAPQDVGLKGELTVQVMLLRSRSATEKRAAPSRRVGAELRDKVGEWMRTFRMGEAIRFVERGALYFSLMLQNPWSHVQVSLPEVGFGVSQILPIIVQGFYAPVGSTLIVEQPEIHLHPAAQCHVGDLLIDVVNDSKQILVETHSEHLIARVQRRVAEGKLKNTDVAIYYCNPTAEGTQVIPVPIDERGQLDAAGIPDGFFEEGYRESLKLFEALAGGKVQE